MMSRCPLVTGSNEPGQTALRTRRSRLTRGPGAACRTGGATVPKRALAVPAVPCPRRSRRATTRARPGSPARPRRRRRGASQPLPASRRTTTRRSSAGTVVRRVERRPRRTEPAGSRQRPRGPRRPAGPWPRAGPASPTLARTVVGRTAFALDQQHLARRRGTAPRARRLPSRRTGPAPGPRSARRVRASRRAPRRAPPGPGPTWAGFVSRTAPPAGDPRPCLRRRGSSGLRPGEPRSARKTRKAGQAVEAAGVALGPVCPETFRPLVLVRSLQHVAL